jgi:putative PIN family toxin of toxin-antitoxin system
MAMASTPAPAQKIVLDTNVTLDWLLFENPELTLLGEAIVRRQVEWIATSAMRDELGFILDGGSLDRWKPAVAKIWAAWDRHCTLRPNPSPGDPQGRPRCTDQDDQMFIDLAIAESANWLISRDKAVLKLARRLRLFGIEVVVPLGWHLLGAERVRQK